jgi:hypothetical protein
MEIYNFNKERNLIDWKIVNDAVMGGKSIGSFQLNEKGHGVFNGTISLENNGGFSFLRYRSEKINISNMKQVNIRLKGDGKRYQFRIKPNRHSQYSYTTYFETSGNWETIEIQLSELIPTFRGKKLLMPNFTGEEIEEIGFLIGNKQSENFSLTLDSIVVE